MFKYSVENDGKTIFEMNGKEKYAIVHTKGNTIRTLGVFDTIEEARSAGKGLASECEGGIVTLISAEFNENGERVGTRERIFESF